MRNRILKRSRNQIYAGVCAGIAEFYGWQPGHVRTVFILGAISGGSGVIAYVILYYVMPPPD